MTSLFMISIGSICYNAKIEPNVTPSSCDLLLDFLWRVLESVRKNHGKRLEKPCGVSSVGLHPYTRRRCGQQQNEALPGDMNAPSPPRIQHGIFKPPIAGFEF